MILGALFDLGLDFSEWKRQIETLNLSGIQLDLKRVSKAGISATQFSVKIEDESDSHSHSHPSAHSNIRAHAHANTQAHTHRGLSEISGIIRASGLSEKVKADSIHVFTRLATVEAKIHSTTIEEVHFHEVGSLDAIVDIVGACLAFEMLAIDTFITTPFTFGTGTVQTSHGTMSVPVPATIALTESFPSVRHAVNGELCTPTGAAIVTTFAKPIRPGFQAVQKKHGYGAGSRDLPDRANVLRICLLEVTAVETTGSETEFLTSDAQMNLPADQYPVYQVECNLDNMNPEILADVTERLLALGCNDVWQESILMKKNRAAVKLCLLTDQKLLPKALEMIATETTTGGIRYFPVERLVAEKCTREIGTEFGKVQLKGIRFPSMDFFRYTPEFESCKYIALKHHVPLATVYAAAQKAIANLNLKNEELTGMKNLS